jgi:hypothetical protein
MNANELHVGFDAWFCDRPKHAVLYMPFVYDAKGMLGDKRDIAPPSGNEVWVFVAERHAVNVDPKGGDIPSYDLGNAPEDVCLQIRARNMMLQGFKTEIIRVPAQLIANKLSMSPWHR